MRISNNILLLIFFAFFAIAVTAPWASNEFIGPGDLKVYIANITEAKLALLQHQFPVRVSPTMVDGMGYPFLQFYSPFLFNLEGLLSFLIENPFLVGKIFIWFALTLGGFYMYRLCRDLTESSTASTLAAICYITAPYLIVAFNMIGHFAETVAQGLLPIVLYYSWQLYKNLALRDLLITAILWSILAMTHMITFAYSLAFIFLLFILLTIQNPKKFWRHLGIFLIAILFAFGLAGWFLFPAMLYKHRFAIDLLSPYTYPFRLLTPFASLTALKAISPIPLPGNGMLTNESYPAIGFPILLGVGICIYAYFRDPSLAKKILLPFLIVFALAFFAAWTPFDFWQYIPKYFVMLQFSYRLLTQVMWSGCILLAFGLTWLAKGEFEPKIFVILLSIVLIQNTSWMHSGRAYPNDTVESLKKFIVKADNRDYAIPPYKLHNHEAVITQKPLNSCKQQNQIKQCTITVTNKETLLALPQLYYPKMLQVEVNGALVDYYPTVYKDKVLTAIKLSPGHYEIKTYFTGLSWANKLSAVFWIMILGILFLNMWWSLLVNPFWREKVPANG